jgi:hypothetical protein
VEVLEPIFTLCLDLPLSDYHCLQRRYASPQHLLAAVSTRWRALMHATPKLWSYIKFSFMYFSVLCQHQGSADGNRYARAVELLLRHSKNYPLSVVIFMDVVGSFDVYEQGFVAIENLFAQASRWRSATLRLGKSMSKLCTENPLRKLSIHWPSSFPQLESLKITNDGHVALTDIIGDQGGVFRNTPRLKRLHIGEGLIFKNLQYQQFPLSQIRTLQLPCQWSLQAKLQCLRATPQFDSLRLELEADSNEILAAPMKIFCRELTLNVYKEGPSTEIPHFFECVQFVGMKSMTLETRFARSIWTAARIQGVLQSMQPSMSDLTCLSLNCLVFAEEALVSLLSLLPSLQILRIFEQDPVNAIVRLEGAFVRGAFFHALTIPQTAANSSENADTPKVIMPELRELELEISCNFTFQDLLVDLLANMVCSRPRLRWLKVKSEVHGLRVEEHDDVQDMVEDLKLRLSPSCHNFRVQGRNDKYRFQLELRRIHL